MGNTLTDSLIGMLLNFSKRTCVCSSKIGMNRSSVLKWNAGVINFRNLNHRSPLVTTKLFPNQIFKYSYSFGLINFGLFAIN